jgi:restriction endonuclease S subunit
MRKVNLSSNKIWLTAKLGYLATTITKGSTPTTYGFDYLEEGIPFVKIENIDNDRINQKSIIQFISDGAHNFQKRSQLKEGDILFSIAGTIGKTCIVTKKDIPGNINQALAIIRGIEKYLSPKFLKLQLLSSLSLKLKNKARGGAMNNISLGDLKNMDIVFPTINEQNRIVEKIEESFSELDKAEEELQKVREQLKIYRQSVLKAAFEGKLTEDWKDKKKNNDREQYANLGSLCIKAEKIKNDQNNEKLIKYIDISSIDNKISKIISHKTYKLKNAPSRAKQIIETGDILFSTVRTYLKNIALVPSEYDEEICSTGFCVIRPKKEFLVNKYIFYYVISEYFISKISSLQTGTSYPAVRDRDIFAQKIPLPPLNEQNQIVQEIESHLSVCDKIEESVESGLIKIEHLRQSILKKAFEGKLVLQDSNDLPAEELLKQIKIEKEKIQNNSKKKVKR